MAKEKMSMKKSGNFGGKGGGSKGGGMAGKKEMGFSSKVGKNHKMFGKDMSPAGK